MDSFYPKFGEVELVLVDDDNDFYDPLETNFECEEEDTKLQLNDTVYEESQFLWNTEETPNRSSVDDDDIMELDRTIKRDISYKNCDYNSDDASNHVKKFDEPYEIGTDSYDSGPECLQNNDSNHTSDVESKPESSEIFKAANKQETNEIISENEQKIEHTNDTMTIEKDQKKTKKSLKNKRKKDDIATESNSECSIKKEPKTRKKCPKEENTV